ncbi:MULTISPECIES: Clp protease N-terminal domain-containing protein [Rhodococcus]|uniref:Clp protease N-terminal domain-containing protein n=1 Tax=Rhodococcus TaxID=1827 RepID=UPI0013CB6252|nr:MULTISPECIES: Clp protease N-terminal domain-containing protein [Rhodococcus]KAF0956743.1 hypothetical protein MLGJGCBP_10151 [Rhodococcus sp. T7]KAF0966616.1 hypothetical protein MLGJGCBP_00241 [Rhodococcus sp. T7]UUK33973.1 hypothetical protein MPY17_40620 [Rhodococcus opacus]
MVFERFSDQARQVVVLAAGAARTHYQNSVGTDHLLVGILDAGGPGTAALTSWGVTAPALESKLQGVSAPEGSAPSAGHIPFTPKTKKVLETYGPRPHHRRPQPTRIAPGAQRTKAPTNRGVNEQRCCRAEDTRQFQSGKKNKQQTDDDAGEIRQPLPDPESPVSILLRLRSPRLPKGADERKRQASRRTTRRLHLGAG